MQEANFTQLAAQLEALIAHYQILHTTLEAERDVLIKNDAAALIDITEKKREQLTQLAADEKSLRQLLPQPQTAELAQLIDQYINQLSAEKQQQLNTLWESLKQCIFKCQRQNTINGGAVHANLELTRRTLKILTHGQNDTMVYDQKGKLE